MKLIVTILFFSILTLSVFSQGNYVIENDAFKYIKKNRKAKKYKIKTISYYPNYVDSLNKGKCEKREIYNLKGNIISEINFPDSKNPSENKIFIYDSLDNLIEIHRYLTKDNNYSEIIYLGYYPTNQLKSMSWLYTKSNSNNDTLLYYYTEDGFYDYKVWSNSKSKRMYIRYNKCNEIEYIETLPTKPESIKLDSNKCIIFGEVELGDDLIGKEKSFFKRTYNSKCKNLTDYTQYFFGNEWLISSHTNTFNEKSELIKVVNSRCEAKSKEKCLKKFEIYSIYKIEYNSKGLEILSKEYDKKEKLKSIYYTDYVFYD